jgi:hypothetical protein
MSEAIRRLLAGDAPLYPSQVRRVPKPSLPPPPPPPSQPAALVLFHEWRHAFEARDWPVARVALHALEALAVRPNRSAPVKTHDNDYY